MTRFNELSFAELHAMNGSELEQYAERGEASRSDLSRGVVHQLHLSDNWLCDMEHRCEFGAGAPVNIRLSMKSHPQVVVCLTSSSDDVPYWQVSLPFDGGASVAWLCCSEMFEPALIFDALRTLETLVATGLNTPEQLAAALRKTGGAV